MAHPKRRHSKSRRDKRRTHQKISAPQMDRCSKCGAVKSTHRVCPSCGYYRGKKILDVEKKQQKKSKKKKGNK
jgi:large subunit ribosomal protein L32